MVEIPRTDLQGQIEELAARDRGVALYDALGRLPGFVVIQKRDPWQATWNNLACARYVFGLVFKEPFAVQWRLPSAFIQNPREFLSTIGYEEVTQPQPRDVVGYAADETGLGARKWFFRATTCTLPIFQHWGIFVGDGMVESKWREGHAYRHPLDAIPPAWGNLAFFFRKRSIYPVVSAA